MKLEKLAEELNELDFLTRTVDTDWRCFTKPRLYAVNFWRCTEDFDADYVKITTSAYKLQKFVQLILQRRPKVLKSYFKEIFIQFYVGNEYRGAGSSPSWMVVRRWFADKAKLAGYYKWIDKGWGDYSAELTYDPQALEEILRAPYQE